MTKRRLAIIERVARVYVYVWAGILAIGQFLGWSHIAVYAHPHTPWWKYVVLAVTAFSPLLAKYLARAYQKVKKIGKRNEKSATESL